MKKYPKRILAPHQIKYLLPFVSVFHQNPGMARKTERDDPPGLLGSIFRRYPSSDQRPPAGDRNLLTDLAIEFEECTQLFVRVHFSLFIPVPQSRNKPIPDVTDLCQEVGRQSLDP